MKKFLLTLAFALPLIFTSCGDDNEDNSLSLDKGSVEINYAATTTIKASEKNCVWSSSNEFVATVDQNGVVTGEHAGVAEITASKDGMKASCNVKVNPTNFTFIMPSTEWGASISSVKNYMANLVGPTLDKETGTSLGYATNGSFPLYTYVFSAQGGLNASALYIEDDENSINLDKMIDFLKQRFKLYGEDDESYFFCNASSKNLATTIIEFGYDEKVDGLMVLCTGNNNTKAGNVDVAVSRALLNEIAKEIKK